MGCGRDHVTREQMVPDSNRLLVHAALTRVSLFNLREASRGWKCSELLNIMKEYCGVRALRFSIKIRTHGGSYVRG